MSYQQLTLEERYQIQVLWKLKYSQAHIARELGRHRSTVCREISRNGAESFSHRRCYTAKRAQLRTHRRRIAKGRASQKIRGSLKRLVEQKLRLSWSPEQIAGRLPLELGLKVSHETIYQHVIRDSREGGALRYCLRFGGYKHHRLKKSKMAKRTRLRKKWIDERPAHVNDRSEFGHWERDTLLGIRGSSAFLTLVERRSRYTRAWRVKNLQADVVAKATVAVLHPHRLTVKSVTNDNGVEFQRDESLERELDVPIYFTQPGKPWQRGSVENANGLIREYVPKSTDIEELPWWMPLAIEDTLNFRPRKILGYKTPYEVFFGKSVRLMSGKLLRFGLEFSRQA